jgi:hypothetical protein
MTQKQAKPAASPVTFHIGQRVVCIDATPNPRCAVMPLVRGRIYVVRTIDRTRGWQAPGWGVLLEGIWIAYPGLRSEWAMHPRRFRPIIERPTNIDVFKKLLDTQLTLPLSEED